MSVEITPESLAERVEDGKATALVSSTTGNLALITGGVSTSGVMAGHIVVYTEFGPVYLPDDEEALVEVEFL